MTRLVELIPLETQPEVDPWWIVPCLVVSPVLIGIMIWVATW